MQMAAGALPPIESGTPAFSTTPEQQTSGNPVEFFTYASRNYIRGLESLRPAASNSLRSFAASNPPREA
jgi:hypothetical protein